MKLIRYKKWKIDKSDFVLAYLIFILFLSLFIFDKWICKWFIGEQIIDRTVHTGNESFMEMIFLDILFPSLMSILTFILLFIVVYVCTFGPFINMAFVDNSDDD